MEAAAAYSTSFPPVSALTLLASLPLTSSALLPILERHQPFVHPSQIPGSGSKFVARVNTAILGRDVAGVEDKLCALGIARELVLQDTEGWVLAGWGKGWVGSALGALSSSSITLSSITPYLVLLQTLMLASPQAPSFERESIHPIMGKLSTTLLKLIERSIGQVQDSQDVLFELLHSTRLILMHSPAAFRPAVNTLRAALLPLIVYSGIIQDDTKDAAISLLTSLYHTQGKAQMAQGWRGEMGDAMLGIGACLDAIIADGWTTDARAAQSALPPGLAPFPADVTTRLPAALYALQGYTEIVLALLSQNTSRPVPVPIAYIVRLAIRCLDLTLDSATVSYISPQHHANLVACLPAIWTTGMILLGSIATSCGDHLLPHLTDILDTTLHLAETIPNSLSQTHTQLLRMHHILLNIFPSAIWHPEHPARLLKVCISKLSPLLDSAAPQTASLTTANGAGGKKGKKRARGEEDGLLASLEGREGRRIGAEGVVALEAIHLMSKLHLAPLLSPALLTLSIRIHLSLHLSLPLLGSRRFQDPSTQIRLSQAVQAVLESACMMVEEGGHSYGWKSVVISVLETNGGTLSPLLHPQLPAMSRPAPPLSSLHLFTTETEDEARLREELGLGTDADLKDTGAEADGGEAIGIAETVIVPMAPQDVRAGKNDILDASLPLPAPGFTVLQAPNVPQTGHYPPPIVSSKPPTPIAQKETPREMALSTVSVVEAPLPVIETPETGMGDEDFVSFAVDDQSGSGSRPTLRQDSGMEVDDDGSDEGIPDLDSGSSDEEDEEEEEGHDISV